MNFLKYILVIGVISLVIVNGQQQILEGKGIDTGSLRVLASSTLDPYHSVHYIPFLENSGSGWVSKLNDVNQFIVVGSDNYKNFTQIITKGFVDYVDGLPKYIKTFQVSYTLDGWIYLSYDNGRVFNANSDAVATVTNQLNPHIVAKAIRIHPLTWENKIGTKLEVIYRISPIIQTGLVQSPCQNSTVIDPTGSYRFDKVFVPFQYSFHCQTPKVTLSINKYSGGGLLKVPRFIVQPLEIYKHGFWAVFYTWGDTFIGDIMASYTAICNE
eukprot:gene3346-4195_t